MTDITHTEVEVLDNTEAAISATEQKQIDKAIAEIKKAEVAKINKIDVAIADMQSQYMAISISGIADREAYLVASDGYKIVRNHRLAVERKRKEIVEFPNKFLKAVNAEATRIKDLLTPIEEHLKLQVGVYEQAEAAEKEKLAQERRATITEAGFKFDGAFYICGIHTISTTQLVDMDEDKLAYYVKEAQSIIAAEKAAEERRIAAVKAQQEAAQKLEADRKALEAERAAFAKQQAEQMAAMEIMRQEMEAMRAQLLPKVETIKEAEAPAGTIAVATPNVFDKAVEKMNAPASSVPAGLKAFVTEHPAPTPEVSAPSHLDNADAIDEAIADSGHSVEYIDGFEHCREAVLAIFAETTPRKRCDFVEAIKLVRP